MLKNNPEDISSEDISTEDTSTKEISIKDLYPELSPAELAEAEINLSNYLEAVREIFERISIENPKILTDLPKAGSFKLRGNRRTADK